MAYDLVKATFAHKQYGCMFSLRPESLQSFRMQGNLHWQTVKFDASNRAIVPSTRGLYAFVVRGDHMSLPPHGFVMYIGESGQGKAHRTLHVRYGEYLKEQQTKKRARVHFMLRAWKSCLDFCYAEVPDKRINLKKLERALNDAMFPPYSTNDFSAEIRDVKKAF